MNNPTSAWPRTNANREPKESRPRPAHEIRFGHIKAAIWRNDTESGVRYNTTFTRLYRDGEQWKVTESFGRDDLLLLAKTADAAHSWIFAQSSEEDEGGNRLPHGPQKPAKV